MALEEIPDPDFSNLWNLLKPKFWAKVMDRLNLWSHMRVSTGGTARGTAKFTVSEEACILDLSKIKFDGAGTEYRNQIVDATAGGLAIVRVRLGFTGGFKSDSSMTDPGDSPVFTLTLASSAGWKYIYCDATMAYSTTDGTWSTTGCEMATGASVPADTATHAYVEFGTAQVASDGAGGWRVVEIAAPSVTGDQWLVRNGDSTNTTHANGRIG